MKSINTFLMLAVVLLFISPSLSFAEAEVKGNIINQTRVKNSVNMALGKESKANLGSVKVKNSKVKGMILNTTEGKNKINMA